MIYQTTILLTLAMAALLIFVPRKYFLLPFILTACFTVWRADGDEHARGH